MTPLPPVTVGNKYGHVPRAEMVDKTQMRALAPWADAQTEAASLEGSGVLPGAVASISSSSVTRQKTGLVHIWPHRARSKCIRRMCRRTAGRSRQSDTADGACSSFALLGSRTGAEEERRVLGNDWLLLHPCEDTGFQLTSVLL